MLKQLISMTRNTIAVDTTQILSSLSKAHRNAVGSVNDSLTRIKKKIKAFKGDHIVATVYRDIISLCSDKLCMIEEAYNTLTTKNSKLPSLRQIEAYQIVVNHCSETVEVAISFIDLDMTTYV